MKRKKPHCRGEHCFPWGLRGGVRSAIAGRSFFATHYITSATGRGGASFLLQEGLLKSVAILRKTRKTSDTPVCVLSRQSHQSRSVKSQFGPKNAVSPAHGNRTEVRCQAVLSASRRPFNKHEFVAAAVDTGRGASAENLQR